MMRDFDLHIFKEEPGVISEGPCWVGSAGDGYLYIADSFLELLWVMLTEWRHDRHLVG